MATADDDTPVRDDGAKDFRAGAIGTGMLTPVPASLRVRREDAGGLPVIVLEGELDLATASQLAAALESFGPGDVIAVDLSLLDFMACAGVHQLMRASAVLGDGLYVVCGRQGPVRRLFEAVGVEQMLSVYPSRAEALRVVRSPVARGRRAWHTPLRRASGVRAARVGHRPEV